MNRITGERNMGYFLADNRYIDVMVLESNRHFGPEFIEQIVDFYDKNWRGCRDFMHIPNKENVSSNITQNRVYIVTCEGVIIGVSTLKSYASREPWYYNNGNEFYNLTGLLTSIDNKKNGINGIGVKLYREMINDVINHNQNNDIIAEIDCRNQNSMKAFSKACEQLGMKSAIVGVYTCEDEEGILTEAPTFIVKVMNNEEKNTLIEMLDYSKVAQEYDNGKDESTINSGLLNCLCNNGIINSSCSFSKNDGITYYGIDPIYYDSKIKVNNRYLTSDISKVKLRYKDEGSV